MPDDLRDRADCLHQAIPPPIPPEVDMLRRAREDHRSVSDVPACHAGRVDLHDHRRRDDRNR